MRVLRVLVAVCVVALVAAPAVAQDRWVNPFVNFSLSAVGDVGPPATVDVMAQATTSGIWSVTSQLAPVWFWVSVFNSPYTTWTGRWSTDYRDAPGVQTFGANFSFTLPNSTDDWYYWGYVSYYGPYGTSYSSGPDSGLVAFQESDRIPTLSTWGLALLGMLMAAGGVLLLRRR